MARRGTYGRERLCGGKMKGSRRQAIMAAFVAAIAPRLAHADTSNVSPTCPPPFIREGDPLLMALTTDLHRWADVNRHVPEAVVLINPALQTLIPVLGEFSHFNTTFEARVLSMPVPWVILARCAMREDEP